MFTLNSDNDQRKNRLGVRFKCKSTLAMCLCCSLRTAPDTPRRTRCRRRSTSWTRCHRANPSPCQGRTVTARSARGWLSAYGQIKEGASEEEIEKLRVSCEQQTVKALLPHIRTCRRILIFVCHAFLLITCISLFRRCCRIFVLVVVFLFLFATHSC